MTVAVVIEQAGDDLGSRLRAVQLPADFFDLEQFPQAELRSVGIERDGTKGLVRADLTAHSLIRNVSFEECVRDPSELINVEVENVPHPDAADA
jgi:hypothetical protein